MTDREVTHDEMINNVLINSDETQTLNDKLKHLEELKEYLSQNIYRFSMASIVAAEYAKLIYLKGEKVPRQQLLVKVNAFLKSNGVKPVSYQFIRKFYQ